MSLVNKVKKLLFNSDQRFLYLNELGLFKGMSDEKYLKKMYKALMKKELNLDNPQTFNEKLQWIKLYDRKPQYTKMVDKYEAKIYVADKIGEKYIIPTLGVWDKFEDINFDELPEQFVLKCTHDSGGVVVCKDKKSFDIEKAKKKINNSLKENFFYKYREWPYKNVKPRIIAEKYIEDANSDDLNDYKLFCFNGETKCCYVCTERNSTTGMCIDYFDLEWNHMPFRRYAPNSSKKIEKPKNYEIMIKLAEVLSEGIPFVRVDFYEIGDEIYFGELTFFPGAGFREFTPDKWDKTFGDWINLPTN